MRHRWLRSLALSLGVLVMGRCALFGAETLAPIVQPYPPVEAAARPEAPADSPPLVGQAFQPDHQAGKPDLREAESAELAPAATLDRPVALHDERSNSDPQIQPTGLFAGQRSDAVVFSPAGTFPNAQPLPVGPRANSTLIAPAPLLAAPPPPDVPYSWRQPPTSYQSAQNASSGTALPMPSPMTVPGSPAASIASPSVVGGPVGTPLTPDACSCDGCGAPGCCTPGVCGDGCCGDGCCDWGNCCGNGCCFGDRWWGSAEYLLWFIRGQSLPPLLTSGSVADNPPGALGQPGTSVLYGGNNVNNNPYSGLRLRGGYWFNDNHGLGLDIGGFFLGGNNNQFTASSMGAPFLARPFVNALTGLQDIEAVATPNGLVGTFTALNTFFLYGAEANLRRNLCCGCNWFIDGFVGWRLLGLNESLSIRENLTVVSSANPNLPAGSQFVVSDRFGTSNLFNGGQIGAIGEYRLGRWFANLRESVGVGGTMQYANIAGSTFSAGPGIPATTAAGGLLAQSSNIGGHTGGAVSFIEETTLSIGYQFTNHIRGFIGYNFLYWTNVARPGNQINPVVNPNLIPPAVGGGPPQPAFQFHNSNFWVQGVNFGVDIRW